MLSWLFSCVLLLPTSDFAAPQSAVAQETETKEIKDPNEIKFPVEMVDFHFLVVDEGQQPIADAIVTIRGLRCQEDPGSWYGWPTPNVGPVMDLATDAHGRVTLRYPVKFGSPVEWKTTSTICTSIAHTNYVFDDIEIAVDGSEPANVDPAHVQTLKEGCHVSFTAQDSNGASITEFGILMAGAGRSAKWQLQNGTIESRGVPDGSWQTMLVAVDEAGKPLFSGVLPARYAKGKDFSIKNVTLRPGLRVAGRLDDNVQRPVKNGVVVAFSVPKPMEGDAGWNTLVSWTDYCDINEDGTFHFDSLPSTGDLQLIAVCDGWVSKDVGWGDTRIWTVQGRFVPLAKEDTDAGKLELELEMEQTGAVEVTVTDDDNQPLSNIVVHSWPNQVYHRFGSTLLGSHYRSLDILKHQMNPEQHKLPGFPDNNRFSATTNEKGVATIYGIPLKRQEGVVAANDSYASVDEVQFQCDSTEPVQVTIRVKKLNP